MKATRKTAKKKGPKGTRSREQLVADAVEDAMRPYLGILPDHALQTMRDILEDTLATHPVAVSALDELTGGPVPDRSGTRTRDEDEDGKGGAS